MSGFADKLLSGGTTDAAAWRKHLIEAHRVAPGMTPVAFAPFKTENGKNSYEMLAECLRGLVKGDSVVLVLAEAQKIPLGDASADAVLCHMALMLMLPIEPVIGEIHRVLAPGGIFAAVSGTPKRRAGLCRTAGAH